MASHSVRHYRLSMRSNVMKEALSIASQKPDSKRRTGLLVTACTLSLLSVAVLVCEWAGWPFMAPVLASGLSQMLARPVVLAAGASAHRGFALRLLGGVTLQVPRLSIGGPAWRPASPTLDARDVRLSLRYVDVWDAWRASRHGGAATITVRQLTADTLDADLFERADGRATWQFGAEQQPAHAQAAPASVLPRFELLKVRQGRVAYDSIGRRVSLMTDITLRAHSPQVGSPSNEAASDQLVLHSVGRVDGQPLKAELVAQGPMPWLDDQAAVQAVPVRLLAEMGKAKLAFTGQASAALDLAGLQGTFELSGPSLADLGAPLGVTLPATGRVAVKGGLRKQGHVWQLDLAHGTVGRSQLGGRFAFDPDGRVPKLSGQLSGALFYLSDLVPTIGGQLDPVTQKPVVSPDNAHGKVLPDKHFNLPSLRAMDAQIAIALDEVDLGTVFAARLKPLKATLTLSNGRLLISDIDARTAQGNLQGRFSLDGQQDKALWQAQLTWAHVKVENWLKQSGRTEPLRGSLSGHMNLSGAGKSTAEILASLDGQLDMVLTQASVSRLAMATAGLDVLRVIGLYLGGDEDIRIDCASASLQARKGVVTSEATVVDTPDTTAWLHGQFSLVDESLGLALNIAPKRFSLVSLRTPVEIGGHFSAPDVSLHKWPIVRRILPAAALIVAAPAAAVLPLLDTGDKSAADKMARQCRAIVGKEALR